MEMWWVLGVLWCTVRCGVRVVQHGAVPVSGLPHVRVGDDGAA